MLRALAGLLVALVGGPVGAADWPGFTLNQPAGEAWQQVQRNAGSVVWMRRLPNPAGSFAAAVITGPAPARFEDADAFLAYVRRSKTLNPEPARFAILLEDFEPVTEPAPRCVRYRVAMTDRAGPGSAPLLLRVTGLACLHPDRPERYFDVQYSSRGPRGVDPADDVVAEGEAFLAGFEFTPPPADGRWALGSGAATPQERERT
jgi:hypothetical protein